MPCFSDKIYLPRGRLDIRIYRRLPSGREKLEDLLSYPSLGENLIVNTARLILRNATTKSYAGAEEDYLVTRMKWGTGGVIQKEGEPEQIRVPTIFDVNLLDPIDDPPHKEVTFAFSGEEDKLEGEICAVTYTAALDYHEGNGNSISEEGLFTKGNRMFAVKCFNPLPKTDEWKFVFSHKIYY